MPDSPFRNNFVCLLTAMGFYTTWSNWSVHRSLRFGRQWSCVHQASSEKEGLTTVLDKKIEDFLFLVEHHWFYPLSVAYLPMASNRPIVQRISVITISQNHRLLTAWLNLLKENTDLNLSVLQFSALLSPFSRLVRLWRLDIISLNKSKTNNFRPEVIR